VVKRGRTDFGEGRLVGVRLDETLREDCPYPLRRPAKHARERADVVQRHVEVIVFGKRGRAGRRAELAASQEGD